MTKKQERTTEPLAPDQSFPQESFDAAFFTALRKVAATPMPPEPRTVYELRSSAACIDRKR